MTIKNTRRGHTQTGNDVMKGMCPEKFLLRAFHACRYNKENYLRCMAESGMTPLLNTPLTSVRVAHSSSPSRERGTQRGFTLIELLVVILIIGVLAAVALPQYQKAVMKSRFIQLQTAGDAFIKAYQLYRLEHGEDPQTFEQLDILPTVGTLSEDKLILYFTEDEQSYCRMYANAQEMDCRRPNTPHLVYYFPTFGGFTAKKDKRVCRGFNETQKQVCLNVGGRFANDGSTYTDYFLP